MVHTHRQSEAASRTVNKDGVSTVGVDALVGRLFENVIDKQDDRYRI